MKKKGFSIWFNDQKERKFFLNEIVTNALLDEMEKRADNENRKFVFKDVFHCGFLIDLTWCIFFEKNVTNSFVESMFKKLKDYNVKLFVNYDHRSFAYVLDKLNSSITYIICGNFEDYI